MKQRGTVEGKLDMNTDTTYKIRPAGRHLLTIGRDLIQDNYAAVVELVKNAYDADSPDVTHSIHGISPPQWLFHRHLRSRARHVQGRCHQQVAGALNR